MSSSHVTHSAPSDATDAQVTTGISATVNRAMLLYVKNVTGKRIALDVTPTDTILQVKQKVEDKEGSCGPLVSMWRHDSCALAAMSGFLRHPSRSTTLDVCWQPAP